MTATTALERLTTYSKGAVAHLEGERDKIKKAFDRGDFLDEYALQNLMLAEGIVRRYRELGFTTADGGIRLREGKTEKDFIAFARSERSDMLRKHIESPESIQAGISAIRQHQNREATRIVLAATAFLDDGK